MSVISFGYRSLVSPKNCDFLGTKFCAQFGAATFEKFILFLRIPLTDCLPLNGMAMATDSRRWNSVAESLRQLHPVLFVADVDSQGSEFVRPECSNFPGNG
jgi:hypothetical protein